MKAVAATTHRCVLCQESVDPDSHLVLRRITGFAQSRGATGGVHGLRDKQWGDEYAHTLCIDRKKAGHRFGQGDLLGNAA